MNECVFVFQAAFKSIFQGIVFRFLFVVFSCAAVLCDFDVDCKDNNTKINNSASPARSSAKNANSPSGKFFVKELAVKGIDVDKFSRIEMVHINTDFAYILTFSKSLRSSYVAKYYKISLKTGRAHLLWSRSLKCNGFPPTLCKKLNCGSESDVNSSSCGNRGGAAGSVSDPNVCDSDIEDFNESYSDVGDVQKSKKFSENSVLRIASGNKLYVIDKAIGNVLFLMNFSSHIENLYLDCQSNHLYVKTCNNRVYCYFESCEVNDSGGSGNDLSKRCVDSRVGGKVDRRIDSREVQNGKAHNRGSENGKVDCRVRNRSAKNTNVEKSRSNVEKSESKNSKNRASIKNSSRIKYSLSENWFNVEYLNYLSQSSRSLILKNGIAITAYGHILCGFDGGEDVFIYNLNEIASVVENKYIDVKSGDGQGDSEGCDADSRDANDIGVPDVSARDVGDVGVHNESEAGLSAHDVVVHEPSVVCKNESGGKVCYFTSNFSSHCAKNANCSDSAENFNKKSVKNVKGVNSKNVKNAKNVNVLFPRSVSMDLFGDEKRFFAIDQSGYVFCFAYDSGLLWSRKCNFFIKSWAASDDCIALSSSDACFLISKSRGSELKKYRLKKLVRVVHADIGALRVDLKTDLRSGLGVGSGGVHRAIADSASYFLAFCANGLYLISSNLECESRYEYNIAGSNDSKSVSKNGSNESSKKLLKKSLKGVSRQLSKRSSQQPCKMQNTSYNASCSSFYRAGVLLKGWNSEVKRFVGYSNGYSFAVIGNKLVILRVYKHC